MTKLVMQTHTATRGFYWFKQAWLLFMKKPLWLVSVYAMQFFLLLLLALLLPFIGVVFSLVLSQFAAVGLWLTVRAVALGEKNNSLTFFSVFQAEKSTIWSLIKLGVLYVIGVVLLFLLAKQGGLGDFLEQIQSAARSSASMQDAAGIDAKTLHLPWGVYVFVAGVVLLNTFFWLAPILVYQQGFGAMKSLFFNALVLGRNLGAMVMLGLCWIGLTMVVNILASLASMSNFLALLMYPVFMGLGTLTYTCCYTVYQDCFKDKSDNTAQEVTTINL